MTEDEIARAKAVADAIKAAWPEKAAEIYRLIAAVEAGHRERLHIDVKVKCRLEKFEGDFEPGKSPIETIETED